MSQLKKIFNTCVKVINTMEDHIMVWLTLVFGLLIMYEVVVRTMGFQGIRWLEEFSRFMLIYTTFIGCSLCVKTDGHMKMDTLLQVLPKKAALVLKVVTNFFCMIIWGFMAYSAFQWVIQLQRMRRSLASVSLPMWPFWIPIVVVCVMLCVRYIIQIKYNIDQIRHPQDSDEEEMSWEKGGVQL